MPAKRKVSSNTKDSTKKQKSPQSRKMTAKEYKVQKDSELADIKAHNAQYASQRYYDGLDRDNDQKAVTTVGVKTFAAALKERQKLSRQELQETIFESLEDGGCLVEAFRKTLQLALFDTGLAAIAPLLDLIAVQTLSFQFARWTGLTPSHSLPVRMVREFDPVTPSADRTLFHVECKEPTDEVTHLIEGTWERLAFCVDVPVAAVIGEIDFMSNDRYNTPEWTCIRMIESDREDNTHLQVIIGEFDNREDDDESSRPQYGKRINVTERAEGVVHLQLQPDSYSDSMISCDLKFRAG
jgi:hypothetical protein